MGTANSGGRLTPSISFIGYRGALPLDEIELFQKEVMFRE